MVVNTVGPFHLLGAAVIEAASTLGANYVDTTGEAPAIRRVLEHCGPRAEKAGMALLTACVQASRLARGAAEEQTWQTMLLPPKGS